MADISLYLTAVDVSRGANMDADQSPSLSPGFECVELGGLRRREGGEEDEEDEAEEEEEGGRRRRRGQHQQPREKPPRRIIHFSSGETMEEYSTDEDEEGEDAEQERKDLLAAPVDAVRSKMTWGPYFWFHMWRAAMSTISACDYLGERMASLFGITSAKYQYAIDEYYRMKKEREEEREESRLSEEAESSFDVSPSSPDVDGDAEEDGVPTMERAGATATYQLEDEHCDGCRTIKVPAIVMTT